MSRIWNKKLWHKAVKHWIQICLSFFIPLICPLSWGRVAKWDFVDLSVMPPLCVGLQCLCYCYKQASKQLSGEYGVPWISNFGTEHLNTGTDNFNKGGSKRLIKLINHLLTLYKSSINHNENNFIDLFCILTLYLIRKTSQTDRWLSGKSTEQLLDN